MALCGPAAAELDGAGVVVSRFLYGDGVNVPDAMIKGGVTYRIIKDHLGSPRLVVDANTGDVAQELEYDAFGMVLTDTTAGFQPFGFAGGLYDHETGLVRFGARDYDASVGRWTAKDPILFGGADANLYGYVFADPINGLDSSGMLSDKCLVCTGKAIMFLGNLGACASIKNPFNCLAAVGGGLALMDCGGACRPPSWDAPPPSPSPCP